MNEKGKLNIKVNFGFVLRVNVFDIEKIKKFIESLEDTTVVFSTISGNRLYITEEGVCSNGK